MKKFEQKQFSRAFTNFMDDRIADAILPLQKDPASEYSKRADRYDELYNKIRELLSPAAQEMIFELDSEQAAMSAVSVGAAYKQGFKDALTFMDTTAVWMEERHDEQARVS